MSDLTTATTDLLREIRLRQWARRSFVSVNARKPTWHPVVLDEMRRRDEELALEAAALVTQDVLVIEPAVESASPGDVSNEDAERLSTCESFASHGYESNSGSRIVPLPPDGMWSMHPAVQEVSAPHYRNLIRGRSTPVETADTARFY